MVKITDGVKSGQGCEGVTVGAMRAVTPAARTVTNLVPAVAPQLQSIDPERTTAGTDICVSSAGRLPRTVWRARPRGASGGRS
eukprot:6644767-Prymnesium_polylepis.1